MNTPHDLDPRNGVTSAMRPPSSACSFQASDRFQPRYRAAFVALWLRSSRLDYIGVGAEITSYRLFDRCRAGKEVPGVVRIGLIDPRATLEIERLAQAVGRSPSELREQTLVSLVALHDANHPNLHVTLLDRPVDCRVELFDGGVFVTPYLGADRFDTAVLHPAGTREYDDRQVAIESMLTGREVLRLGAVDERDAAGARRVVGDHELADLLRELGLGSGLSQLRRRFGGTARQLRRDVAEALGAEIDYF